jgi:glucose/arabinose dehydrogenase
MKIDILFYQTLWASFFFCSLVICLFSFLIRPNRLSLARCALLGILLSQLLVLFSSEVNSKGYANELIAALMTRDKLSILALMAGGLLSLGWWTWDLSETRDVNQKSRRLSSRVGIWGLLFANALIGFLFVRQQFPSLFVGPQLQDSRFRMEVIGNFDLEPICICADPDGGIYTSLELFLDGRESGRIHKFSQNSNGDWIKTVTMAADGLLNRPNGLTWHEGALYVSRSGRGVHATESGIVYDNTGAVTRCRDLDGNGQFDDYLDIVKDLPGFGSPDSQHGNNGIGFDSRGDLFVCVGSPANRAIVTKPLEASVLRYKGGVGEPEVFARGFRNPFGLVITPNDEIFVTDQDCDENPGDEVNHVIFGAHYGHPYAIPGEPQAADSPFTEPIHIGDKLGNLTGFAYTNSDRLPEEYRDCLYVADIALNSVFRLKLSRKEGKVMVSEVTKFLTVPRPVGVAITADGSFYVITRRPDNKLYRITLKD